MNAAPDAPLASVTIAGHHVVVGEHAGAVLSLRIALDGIPCSAFARALSKMEGVRVTTGPEISGGDRCYIAHCPGFKMVVSPPDDGSPFAPALVSRTPQTALAALSDLQIILERLMSAPPPRVVEPDAVATRARSAFSGAGVPLRRSALAPGKPLTRKAPLRRNKPLGRGRPVTPK
jgi:hypothetical protein